MKAEEQVADLLLVAPSQPWYLEMLSLLASAPLRISPGQEAMVQVEEVPFPELGLPLAVWRISGSITQAREFLQKLPSFTCRLGDGSSPNCMTPSTRGGSAGVVSGVLIPFQDLQRLW